MRTPLSRMRSKYVASFSVCLFSLLDFGRVLRNPLRQRCLVMLYSPDRILTQVFSPTALSQGRVCATSRVAHSIPTTNGTIAVGEMFQGHVLAVRQRSATTPDVALDLLTRRRGTLA